MMSNGRLCVFIALLGSCVQVVAQTIKTVSAGDSDSLTAVVPIDARAQADCLSSSVLAARCLPADAFVDERGELASFRDVVWALGTAGLDGSEQVIVFADSQRTRDFVSALLFLVGMRTVMRWEGGVTELQQRLGSGRGRQRGLIRSRYFAAPMRDDWIALNEELDRLRTAGWRLIEADAATARPSMPQQEIVVADDPIAALAQFTGLLASGATTVKVVVDPFDATAEGVDYQMRLLGAVALGTALLLLLLAWRLPGGRK